MVYENDAPSGRLFVYGTLMVPTIYRLVTGREPRFEPAVLPGYRRVCIRNASYPGLIVSADSRTEGLLTGVLDPATLYILDRYEGPMYRRIAVHVSRPGDSEVSALTYVLHEACHHLVIERDWDWDEFTAGHPGCYMDLVRSWMGG